MYRAINAFGELVQQVRLSFDDRFVPVKGGPAAFVLELTIQDGQVYLRQTSGKGLVFYVETYDSQAVQDGFVSREEWINIGQSIELPYLDPSNEVEVFLPGSSEILGFERAFRDGIGPIVSLYRKVTSEIPNSAGLPHQEND